MTWDRVEKLVCSEGCKGPETATRTEDMKCAVCDKLYSRHPYCVESKAVYGGEVMYYYIHVLCDGRHVKL